MKKYAYLLSFILIGCSSVERTPYHVTREPTLNVSNQTSGGSYVSGYYRNGKYVRGYYRRK